VIHQIHQTDSAPDNLLLPENADQPLQAAIFFGLHNINGFHHKFFPAGEPKQFSLARASAITAHFNLSCSVHGV